MKQSIYISSLFIGILFLSWGTSAASVTKTMTVQPVDLQYAADFSNDKILMGASHNVFVGKVIAQIGTEERGIGPETQFQVEVISNIKGELKGSVVVDQIGGYKDGKLYTFGDMSGNDSNYLLAPGSTYVFATRYNDKKDWYTLNTYPTARQLIDTNPSSNLVELFHDSESNTRVQELETAYREEIPLDVDMHNGNALNSYRNSIPSQVSN